MPTSDYLLSRRNDLSGYLVHLTRDYQNKSAKKNLRSILKSRCIEARNAHCLFMSKIGKLQPSHARRFRTVCFTETPLSELNYLTQTMEDRSIHMSQYGLVFEKEVIRQAGGNPVFYLDTRSDEGKRRCDAFWDCFREAQEVGLRSHPFTSFLPYINKVDGKIDFSWEREWRIASDFSFDLSEVFLGLAPKDQISELEDQFSEIHWISPRWGRDQIITKLRELAERP
jgi:hypothetical protein